MSWFYRYLDVSFFHPVTVSLFVKYLVEKRLFFFPKGDYICFCFIQINYGDLVWGLYIMFCVFTKDLSIRDLVRNLSCCNSRSNIFICMSYNEKYSDLFGVLDFSSLNINSHEHKLCKRRKTFACIILEVF